MQMDISDLLTLIQHNKQNVGQSRQAGKAGKAGRQQATDISSLEAI